MTRPTFTVRGRLVLIRRFAVTVVEGSDAGARGVSSSEELSIGTAEGNDLQLTDAAVSRHHCALRVSERGLELHDLGSRNGTHVGDLELIAGVVKNGVRIRIGKTTLAVEILDDEIEQPIASDDRFGPLIGTCTAMRRLYPLIEQCAKSAATVLITGETGTGKELIAEAIHERSGRTGAFVVVDCGALPHDLAESELFGHERGAFTGADALRIGALEAADGGTVFLDEIGELPLELQPLLLRVLEARTIRRLGTNVQRPIDIRVVAASHRDLRAEVNVKRFRADLFYRLNVLRISVPPLREREGDIALIAEHFWRTFRSDAPPAGLLEHFAAQSWPGNIRELRNAVERAALLGWQRDPRATPPVQEQLTYQDAKERAVHEWERGWVENLMTSAGRNLSRAARMARMGRSHLRELARRHGVATRSSATEIAPDDDD